MNITNTKGLHSDSVKCVVYGKSGVGKTTLLGTADNGTTLIISAESGLLSLSDKSIDVVEITTWQDLIDIFIELRSDKKYQTIGIDSLTEIADKLISELQKIPEYKDPKNTFKMWGTYNEKMLHMLKAFRDLNKNIIFTALEENVKDSEVLIKKPMISGNKAQSLINALFDEVFYLTVNPINNERELHTQPTTIFDAKDRSGKLEITEEPNLTTIFNKIKGQSNDSNKLKAV